MDVIRCRLQTFAIHSLICVCMFCFPPPYTLPPKRSPAHIVMCARKMYGKSFSVRLSHRVWSCSSIAPFHTVLLNMRYFVAGGYLLFVCIQISGSGSEITEHKK